MTPFFVHQKGKFEGDLVGGRRRAGRGILSQEWLTRFVGVNTLAVPSSFIIGNNIDSI